ncbi:MAG: FAD-dependent monooxygenase [Polyangiaceae bacterium]
MPSIPVLIVGAGPVGLALACSLRAHGVAAVVVDRAEGPVRESRATDIHARTLELLAGLGVTERLIARGKQSYAAWFYSEGKRVAGFETKSLATPYPFILGLPQFATQEVLAERLSELGGEVWRQHTFVSLEQEKSHVGVRLLGPDNAPREVRADWVVGSDGAQSTVRTSLGVPFEGATYEEHFLLADLKIRWELSGDELHLFLTEEGFFMVLPMPGGWVRTFASVRGDSADAEADLGTFLRLIESRVHVPCEVTEAGWIARFKIHRRMVPRYRTGRVFLAGDAAHIHSPVGGQGMNIGVQDAVNLGFKLALVVRGQARPELLDSYHAERHSAASRTLLDTHLATTVSMIRSPALRFVRDLMGRATVGSDALARWMCELVASFHTDVRDSPAVASVRGSLLFADVVQDLSTEAPSIAEHLAFSRGPRSGDRVPHAPFGAEGEERFSSELISPVEHTLVLFDGLARTPEGYRNLAAIAGDVERMLPGVVRCRVVVPDSERPSELPAEVAMIADPGARLHSAFEAHAECAFLLRPDGYVGFRCQPAEHAKILGYLGQIFVPAR